MTNAQLAIHFFLQIALILSACRIVGFIARPLGQPPVVWEMVTGILLGPSFFGSFCPESQQFLFPWDPSQSTRDTQSYLYPVSQLGLVLYMFVVGLEFRTELLWKHFRSSLAVSMAGMIVPFLLGGLVAWVLFSRTSVFPEGTSLSSSVLFLGASLCITAFPMLARILESKGASGSLVGTIAIGAAAIGDVVAWCLVAIVLATIDGNPIHALRNIAGGLGFAFVAIVMVRPQWKKISHLFLDGNEELHEGGFACSLVWMALGALFTELIGLHSIFGAFVMGAIAPRGPIERDLVRRIQPFVVVLLLPLFFTYSGLHTRIGLLNEAGHWGICGVILLTAIVGKGAACWIAGRCSGLDSRQALGIGALMNARGLMELIIINVGLERGLITEELFTMLVVMAVVTTLMASPIFSFSLGTSSADRKSS